MQFNLHMQCVLWEIQSKRSRVVLTSLSSVTIMQVHNRVNQIKKDLLKLEVEIVFCNILGWVPFLSNKIFKRYVTVESFYAILNSISFHNTSSLTKIKNFYQPLHAFKFTLKVSYSLNGSRYFYSYFNWKILYFIVEGKKFCIHWMMNRKSLFRWAFWKLSFYVIQTT